MTEDNKAAIYSRPQDMPDRLDTESYAARMGLGGALESFAKRRAAARFAKELDALSGAIDAARRVNTTKETYARSLTRVSRENLDRIGREEDERVQADLAEQELRRATAERRKATFERRAAIEDEDLEAELLEAKLRRKRAHEALHGTLEIEDSPETKRAKLNTEIDEVMAKLRVLDDEYLRKTDEGTIDDAYEASYNLERNRIIDRLDKLGAEEEAL